MLKGDVAACMGYAAGAGAGEGSGGGGASAGGGGGGGKGGGLSLTSFSKEELRDLFKFNTGTACDTVEVLEAGGKSGGAGSGAAGAGGRRGPKRQVPEHWRRCASAADGGVEDAPLASAMTLTYAGPANGLESGAVAGGGAGGSGGEAGDALMPGSKMVSFVAKLPSKLSAAAASPSSGDDPTPVRRTPASPASAPRTAESDSDSEL